MAKQARRSMKKHARIEAEAARVAEWIGKAEARARQIHQSHDVHDALRKERAAMEAEAKKPGHGRHAPEATKPCR